MWRNGINNINQCVININNLFNIDIDEDNV